VGLYSKGDFGGAAHSKYSLRDDSSVAAEDLGGVAPMHFVAARDPTSGLTAAAMSERDAPRGTSEVVYLIESDARLRESLSLDLTLAGVKVRDFQCAGDYFNCIRQDTAACIIVDLQLSDIDGFDLQSQLHGEGGPPTIFISAHSDIYSGIRAIKAGAIDFLVYPVEPKTLLFAVKEAFSRDCSVRQRRAEISGLNERYLRLTPREREVFTLVVRGFLNKQVAAVLTISQITVQIHRGNLMRKMRARSFADLVCMAVRLQLLGNDLADRLNSGAAESFMLSRIGTW
jgi:FixJ family two-component response regulator